MLRWGQRGLNQMDKALESGSLEGVNVTLIAAAPILFAVQLKQMYEQYMSELAAMKRDIQRQTGINGDTYDRWLKIQSDPLLRRNI